MVKELRADKEVEGMKLYTLKTIQSYFGISDKALKKYIKKAGVSTIRIGHNTYLNGDDLIKIIQPKQREKGFWRH